MKMLPVLLLLSLAAAGCGDGGPRGLPFPRLEARSPFPELMDRRQEAAPAAARRTSFADRLAPAAPEPRAEERVEPRTVPVGSQLSGEIPATPAWSWQRIEDGVTLIACRPAGSRPTALIYAEAFPARMRAAPSEEIQRFQLTVNPEAAEQRLIPSAAAGAVRDSLVRQVARGTGGGRTDAARLLQLLATRTAGAGLGFHPAAGSFTGWKWVGKNDRQVTVRLARFTGTWEPRAAVPAEIARRLEALRNIPALSLAADAIALSNDTSGGVDGGVSAYLLIGSATDDAEQSGAHLALLWQHAPDLQCIEGLAAFLASLRTGGPAAPAGLDDGQAFDLPEAAGLQLLPAGATLPLDQLKAPVAPPAAPGTASDKLPS